LLDELIDPSLGQQIPAEADLVRSVERLAAAGQGAEAVLEGLNYLKLATGLRIAVAQLKGTLSAEQAQLALSGLAAAILKGVLAIAGKELEVRHGRFPSRGIEGGAKKGRNEEGRNEEQDHGNMAVIAYGTLGAKELGYDSDLDIVFLFEAGDELSDGPRPLPAERYYARVAQRVLSFLTVMTPSGRLFEVDTRLRPNGRAGSLVSSIGAFREYQLNEAWTWELQALTRSRFIAGSPSLAVRLGRIRQEVLCRTRDPEKLRSDLWDMRQKMHKEHAANARFDPAHSPKYRPGGLIDIEFIAQLGILASAHSFPKVLKATGTLPQIAQLKSIGWLTEDEAFELEQTVSKLRQQRMIASLVPGEQSSPVNTRESARIFKRKLGTNGI
jgi:glutamate-ammonia-ligase adenylyltransferase